MELTTPHSLLEKLRESVGHVLTREEINEQRVSFVYGQMSHDSNISREQVKEMLKKQAGE